MHSLQTIATVRSPYQEKFAIPRQPGLVKSATGRVILQGEFNQQNCILGLEAFSHIWLTFIFHQTISQGWKAKVRPPRLGGNEKVGVFASRSTFRPNGLGLSVVKLDKIIFEDNHWQLCIRNFDLLDETPIVDIKPYLTYADSLPDAYSSYANTAPELMPVRFSPPAESALKEHNELRQLISEVLAQDPRPAYQRNGASDRVYGVKLAGHNIRWQVCQSVAVVTEVSDC